MPRLSDLKPAVSIRLVGGGALGVTLLSAVFLQRPAAPQAAAPAQNPAPAAKRTVIPYPRPATPEQLEHFEKKVRPILVARCYNCHSDAFKGAGGLRVDTGRGIFKGGNSGPAIIPGQPEQSLLIARLKTTDPNRRMPQETKEPLPAEEIAILEAWIQDGAAWPDETEKPPHTPTYLRVKYSELKSWWAWQPLKNPTPPEVKRKDWSQSPIDRFILAKLEANKMAPVADADPVTLVRRLYYDLTGLPPTPADIQAFVRDPSPRAYAALVDRLLASPQFGERWGRHWLDLARYGESTGPSRNIPYPHAWRYRDYVIDAYNRDVPYNRFVQEQLAGDLLPAATGEERDRLTIATGFLALGVKDVNQRFKERFKMDNVDEMIDTVTRSTLALSVACARCHDHKFDPIPTRDYYALAGIFASAEDGSGVGSGMGGSGLFYYKPKLLGYLSSTPKEGEAKPENVQAQAKLKAQLEEARKALMEFNRGIQAERRNDPNRMVTAAERTKRQQLQRRVRRLTESLELANDLGEQGYGIHCMREGEVADTSIRIRGEEERHGPIVPRGYLQLIRVPDAPRIPADRSGRLELAKWITSPANPLTPRVYVNRVWHHLFGAGLVRTVDNFGSTGDRPSHPELLDYLARTFIRNGWSTKRLIREIVLTRAYRLGGSVPAGYRERDPENRLVWRHSPRRLTAEEIRDSILLSSGQLELQPPKGASTMSLRMIEIRDDGPVVQSVLRAADRNPHRSIYLPQLRGAVPRQLAAFDPVTQTLVTGKRDATVVPAQALFILNSPFVREDADRVAEAYQRVLGRTPRSHEVTRAAAFVRDYADTWAREHGTTVVATAQLIAAPAVTRAVAFNPTAGVARADNLTQDDPEQNAGQVPAAASLQPRTPNSSSCADAQCLPSEERS
jgi:hypothetical protein